MVTVNSINEFLSDNDGVLLDETNISTTFTKEVYSPKWNLQNNLKKIPNKHKKNYESIVDLRSNKRSSLCSSKLKISNDKLQPFQRLSSTHISLHSQPIDETAHQTVFQSNQNPLNSYSSSQYTSSDDFFNNNPFVNRLRNPTVAQKYGHSYFDSNSLSTESQNTNFDAFFPECSTITDSFIDNFEFRVIIILFYINLFGYRY